MEDGVEVTNYPPDLIKVAPNLIKKVAPDLIKKTIAPLQLPASCVA